MIILLNRNIETSEWTERKIVLYKMNSKRYSDNKTIKVPKKTDGTQILSQLKWNDCGFFGINNEELVTDEDFIRYFAQFIEGDKIKIYPRNTASVEWYVSNSTLKIAQENGGYVM